MKSTLVKAALLACLFFLGWSYDSASAASTWAEKCRGIYGGVQTNVNPSYQHVNCLLTNAALDARIPPEVVKAVAEQESGWIQYKNGRPNIAPDNGIGIMQITGIDDERLKTDIIYNIQTGVNILKDKYEWERLPKIQEAGPEVIENWYFPVMAYNGIKPVNSPLEQKTEKLNVDAYQEQVFAKIKSGSFLDSISLAKFPFTTKDFTYDTNSTENIKFNKPLYTITSQLHPTNYYFQTGNKVVTVSEVNLRKNPSTDGKISPVKKTVPKNTTLTITGPFRFTIPSSSKNVFVWYPVKLDGTDVEGYISSAYISRKVDAPTVNAVDDNDTTISGKAPAGVSVQIKNGTKLLASATTDKNRNFIAKISQQKAGAKLSFSYKGPYNAPSLAKTITVTDKTAPAIPSVNKVTNKSTVVSGKTEAKAIVSVTVSGKTYSVKADSKGYYKISIPIKNSGTKLSVSAKDASGNKSRARAITVVRVAPNIPTVNRVTSKTKTVSGKTEKKATVTIKIGKKTYSAKATSTGKFTVKIPKQRAGSKLYVAAKDSKRKVSATRTVKVVK
ncbi:Ig-like domain-containing protein [Bacillus rubiinfantis]|uniref:Ig-like domain-containing protein n=1 Tax=Bacillus rubiinfantis TaxID=1499680 RepID=UPI0009E344F3|nr:Ig-like domain-containing protein [Bacillus rubiinfantis]